MDKNTPLLVVIILLIGFLIGFYFPNKTPEIEYSIKIIEVQPSLESHKILYTNDI